MQRCVDDSVFGSYEDTAPPEAEDDEDVRSRARAALAAVRARRIVSAARLPTGTASTVAPALPAAGGSAQRNATDVTSTPSVEPVAVVPAAPSVETAEHRVYRAFLTLIERNRFLTMKGAATFLQREVRSWLQHRAEVRAAAAVALRSSLWAAHAALPAMDEHTFVHLSVAVTKLQARWRGFLVRKRRDRAVHVCAQRIAIACRDKERGITKTLRSRTTEALRVLASSKQLTHVLVACTELEVATRLSSACSIACLKVNAAPSLFALVRSCDRSPAHQQLVRKAVGTLRNICTWGPQFAGKVCKAREGPSVLLDVLQMFRDELRIVRPALDLFCTLLAEGMRLGRHLGADTTVWKRVASLRDFYARRADLERSAAGGAGAVHAKAPEQFSLDGTVREYDRLLGIMKEAAAREARVTASPARTAAAAIAADPAASVAVSAALPAAYHKPTASLAAKRGLFAAAAAARGTPSKAPSTMCGALPSAHKQEGSATKRLHDGAAASSVPAGEAARVRRTLQFDLSVPSTAASGEPSASLASRALSDAGTLSSRSGVAHAAKRC